MSIDASPERRSTPTKGNTMTDRKPTRVRLTPDDIADLRRLAAAASPGEWLPFGDDTGRQFSVMQVIDGYAGVQIASTGKSAANAAYIAAVKPAVLEALLAQIAQLEADAR